MIATLIPDRIKPPQGVCRADRRFSFDSPSRAPGKNARQPEGEIRYLIMLRHHPWV
jgi:hypothetical protein